ncbi:MAG: hypothetical protein HY684_04945 [Chloroflexi bacterium]|nr:hypothetical protein [Chloroflexota bacterium]
MLTLDRRDSSRSTRRVTAVGVFDRWRKKPPGVGPDDPGLRNAPRVRDITEEYERVASATCACGGVYAAHPIAGRQMLKAEGDRHYDVLETLCLFCGARRDFAFDVSGFFGRPRTSQDKRQRLVRSRDAWYTRLVVMAAERIFGPAARGKDKARCCAAIHSAILNLWRQGGHASIAAPLDFDRLRVEAQRILAESGPPS